MIDKIKKIDATCKKYNINHYTINKDGSIDVDNNVDLSNKGLVKLPLKFNIVKGNCVFSYNELITLKGSPEYVNGTFDCYRNRLTSLKYSPKEIGEDFFCLYNNLANLKYGPERVGKNYNCGHNDLITLKETPKIIYGDFICLNNKLKNLNYGPEFVYGHYDCSINYLKTLKGCAKYIKKLLCVNYNDDLYSFEGLTDNVKGIQCENTTLYNVWKLFEDASKIDLFNDMDIIREDSNGNPVIILNRLNQFLDMVGKPTVKKVDGYINM